MRHTRANARHIGGAMCRVKEDTTPNRVDGVSVYYPFALLDARQLHLAYEPRGRPRLRGGPRSGQKGFLKC